MCFSNDEKYYNLRSSTKRHIYDKAQYDLEITYNQLFKRVIGVMYEPMKTKFHDLENTNKSSV